ncbi:MAG: NAD-dependent epimerase/dehydratase family protein [candidate division NC10 bacterium]|nr:NAD-dependent epimerase/dehydratase family protein [candidate division NC10 bacterium]
MSAKPRSLWTGAGGFIGSHLRERRLAEGHEVVGLDGFIDLYPRWRKESNLVGLLSRSAFRCIEADLLQADLVTILDEIDLVFHQAWQRGVREGWGTQFEDGDSR